MRTHWTITGFKGNFETGIIGGAGQGLQEIAHGIIILATGGEELKPLGHTRTARTIGS